MASEKEEPGNSGNLKNETGAESSCWILTMIETAKIHNLSPEDYLRCVFERAPYCETTADWEKLLPWNIEITPFQPRGQWKND